MAGLVPFTQHEAFDPETAHAMAAVFEASWSLLKDTGHIASAPPKVDATREMLAKSIMEAAKRGVRDPNIFHQEALVSLAKARLLKQAWAASVGSIGRSGMRAQFLDRCPHSSSAATLPNHR